MYRSSYAEVLDHAPHNVRDVERAAILRSIQLLEKAEKAGTGSVEATEALFFMRRLWEFFLMNLSETDNPLPEKLRAELISIGIGLLKEEEAIRSGKSQNFKDLREISQIIADGLS
jgi:flagellar biosynthesis activator protein FlaF